MRAKHTGKLPSVSIQRSEDHAFVFRLLERVNRASVEVASEMATVQGIGFPPTEILAKTAS